MRKLIFFLVLIVFLVGLFVCLHYKKVELKDFLSLIWFIPLTIFALFQEDFKNYLSAPKLKLEFKLEEPYCLKTQITQVLECQARGITPSTYERKVVFDAYYFRFRVRNIGKTQARLCECVAERLWINECEGKWEEIKTFQAVNLNWSNAKSQDEFLNINPHSPGWFCDLVHTEQVGSQAVMHIDYKFPFPNSQYKVIKLNVRHKILVTVYSENAKPVSREFEIYHSGQWKAAPEEMFFKEVTIK